MCCIAIGFHSICKTHQLFVVTCKVFAKYISLEWTKNEQRAAWLTLNVPLCVFISRVPVCWQTKSLCNPTSDLRHSLWVFGMRCRSNYAPIFPKTFRKITCYKKKKKKKKTTLKHTFTLSQNDGLTANGSWLEVLCISLPSINTQVWT